MKALTLHQPWAALLALWRKRYETRPWLTNHRGPLAIHAGKNRSHVGLLLQQPFMCDLNRAGIVSPADLHFGAVIAVGKLVSCQLITPALAESVSETERLYGDWTPGRYAWGLQSVSLVGPYPCRGHQQLWNWVPKDGEHEWGDVT